MILTFLTTLLIINAIVLFFLVLILQHGNEGGMGASLGGGNSTGMLGASGGVKLIVRATWICGTLFFILALTTSWIRTHERYSMANEIEKSLVSELEAPAAIDTSAAANVEENKKIAESAPKSK